MNTAALRFAAYLSVLLVAALMACGPEPLPELAPVGMGRLPPPGEVPEDGGPEVDGGLPNDDAGTADAGTTDAGTTDAGSSDAGVPDAGLPPGTELNAGFIGGACSSSQSCSSPAFTQPASCETGGFQNGMCTQACTQSAGGSWLCPDTQFGPGTGNTTTRCISGNGSPRCVAACDFAQSETGCRPGYTCVLRQRYGAPATIFPVCLPSEGQRWPGEPAPANDVGQACSSPQQCAHLDCLTTPGGYCAKSMCEFAGCPAGTRCFSVGSGGQTACLKDCSQASQCRVGEGYECNATHGICWPGQPSTPSWNPAVGAADCASAWGTAGSGLSPCDSVKDDYIVVRKSARNVALCNNGSVVANFRGGLGFAPVGDKVQEGDGKTPEGVFYVAALVPNSSYYRAFLLSYPDKDDAQRGLNAGLITQAQKNAIDTAQNNCTTPPQNTALGSYLEIHGMGGGSDWTLGCVAVENHQMDQLWAAVGTRDTIVVLP